MTSEQWQRVKELFEEALELPQPERADFLATACPDDDEIKTEVLSLLNAHERDSVFMSEPVGMLLPDEEPILHAGQRLGNYEIDRPLGKGGMGQVYLALDTRLGRQVALKLLPSSYTHDTDHVHRLEQEARAASALNHPNIVTIHEIGEADSVHFMATEFVDGETLRQCMSDRELSVREIVDIAVQVASALRAAHEADLVHRDVKPENIMLRRDGVVKVLDFGLAKLTSRGLAKADSREITARSMVHTQAGTIMGTVGYMSPEQARGDSVDGRTDVWSLGVVLYEMIAGRAPFVGENQRAVVDSILRDDPQAFDDKPDVPFELTQIISKALTKDATARYASAAEMANELKGLKEELKLKARLERDFHGTDKAIAGRSARDTVRQATLNTAGSRQPGRINNFVHLVQQHKVFAGVALILIVGALSWTYIANTRNKPNAAVAASKRSIAVLPLKSLNANSRDQIYEVGIVDAVIQRLSNINGLVVRQLSATRQYTDDSPDPVGAGKEQQVDYVLASTYQLDGSRIHIDTQLVNVATGQIEAKYSFDEETSDYFALQDRIAKEIGNKLGTQFVIASKLNTAKRGTNNRDAYRLYVHGMYLANSRNADDAVKAITALEQAVALDPNYAQAWAGLGYARRTLSLFRSDLSTRETYQGSMEAINKALALDQNLSEARSALCENKYLYEWDFAGAEKECRLAIELDPNSAQAHEIFSRYLMGRGRHAEAIAEIETAIDLEPASRFNHRNYGRALFYARRYQEAEDQLKRVVAMDRNFLATYGWLAWSVALQGKEVEAFEWVRKLSALRKVDNEKVQILENAFRNEGWRGVVRQWASEPNPVLGQFDLAMYHAQLGQKNEAFDNLEKLFERRAIWVTYLRAEPRLDPLRDDPRFADLMRRVDGN